MKKKLNNSIFIINNMWIRSDFSFSFPSLHKENGLEISGKVFPQK